HGPSNGPGAAQTATVRIGSDLGGTKIEAIALSPAGEEIARRRLTTPRDYVASLDAIAALVRELERAADAAGTVGVGIPGAVASRTGLVKNANSTWLNGRPLGRDLEQRLGRPVRRMNDANRFALSEATDVGAPGAAAPRAASHARLGAAVAALINVLGPDVVVLGGGMSNIAGLPEATSALLPRYLFAAGASSDPVATRVVGAAHGDTSGVR